MFLLLLSTLCFTSHSICFLGPRDPLSLFCLHLLCFTLITVSSCTSQRSLVNQCVANTVMCLSLETHFMGAIFGIWIPDLQFWGFFCCSTRCPTCWCHLRFTSYQGSLSWHTVMTVDVLMTWMQCLCPTVMSHLEQAACLCFVNRGLGDMTFAVGLVDRCTNQTTIHSSHL